ncbi:receptor-type tyrosine-protein phosphatase eta-like isoform X2 [Cloeon dipterum]|uniref:receptor-type tyrosine-protein phosphatase eta-like isoform X2 n=1 Tax=Cloeon dipterum TaxID=197152 RepID=UPI0032203502
MCKMKLREVALVLFLLVLIQGGKGNNVSTEANADKSIEGKNNGPKALDKSNDSLSSNLSSSDPTEEAPVTTPATKNTSLASKVTQPVSTSQWSTSSTTLGVRQPAGVTTGNEQTSASSFAPINGPPTTQQINASTSAFPSTITLTTIVMGSTSKPRAVMTKQSSAPSNGPLSTNKSIVSSTTPIPSTSTLITATEEVSSTLITSQDENSKIEENTASIRSESQTSTENTDSSASGAGIPSTDSSKEPASPDITETRPTSTKENTKFSTATTADEKPRSSTLLTESMTPGELLPSPQAVNADDLSATTNKAAKSDPTTTDRTSARSTQKNNANDAASTEKTSTVGTNNGEINGSSARPAQTTEKSSTASEDETIRMLDPRPTTSDGYASSLSTNSIDTSTDNAPTTTAVFGDTTENNTTCVSKLVQNLNTSSETWKIIVSWESPCKGKEYTFSITKNETCLNPADPQTKNTNETSMIFDTGLRGDCNYTFSVAARLLNDATNDAMIVTSESTSLRKHNAELKVEKIKAECRWNLSWIPESEEVADIEIISMTKTKKINATSGTATVEYADLQLKERAIIKLSFTNNKSVTIPVGESEIYDNGTSAVRNLKFNDSKNLLSWEKPETICGSVKNYEVKINGNKTYNTKEGSLEFRVDENVIEIQENATAVVTPLDSSDKAGEPAEVNFTKKDDIPPEPSDSAQANITGSADASKPSRQVVISWPKNLFGSKEIVRWEVLIQNSSVADSEAETGGYEVNAKKPLKWIEFTQGQKGFYRPTKDDWKPKEEGGKYFLVVGTEECNNEKDYCNGLLNPNTKYTYKIRGFSKIGFRDSRALSVETGEYTGVASQIVVSILFIAIAGVVMFGLYYTRRNHPRCIQKAMIYLRPLRQSRDPILEMQEKRPLVSKAIPKDEFSKYLEELLNIDENEETNELAEQFKQLALLSPPPPSTHPENYSAAMIQYNKHKNRYINILPYDSTRVVLKQISPNDPESDYINASYVKGFSGETEYIACQGPRADTAEDFWRMVFEKDVCVIAMVTHLEEKGKEKCHKYFPDMRETIRYEMVAVKCVLQADFPVFTRRTFLVQETNGVLLKTVIHLHFKEWPDFGCPETTDLLLNYTKNVREAANEHKGGLMLVHCSAGVGRTGTLIALDILLQQIRVSTSFNIFDTILQMRYHRINMVQTEAQYKFIHECVRDAIEEEKKNGQWFAIGNGGANKQDPIYQNLNKEKSVSIITEINEIDDEVDSEIEKSAEGNSTEGTQDQIYQNVNKERPRSIKIEVNEVKDKVAVGVDFSSDFGQQKPTDIDLIKNHAKDEVATVIEKSAEQNSPGENQDPIYLNVSQEKPPESQESKNDGSGEKPTQPIIPVLHLANAAEATNENVEMTEEIVPLVEQSETLEVTKL